jgi:membrane protease YdiL (CAAX protease family)
MSHSESTGAPPSTGSQGDSSSPAAGGPGLPISVAWLFAMFGYHIAATVVTHYHKPIGAVVQLSAFILFFKPLKILVSHYLVGAWKALNLEAEKMRAADPPGAFDYRPLVVLAVSAVVVTSLEYFGGRNVFQSYVAKNHPALMRHALYQLMQFAYWSGFRVTVYIIVPWLTVLLMPGERMRDYGLSFEGVRKHLWVYGLLFLLILPSLVMVSMTPPFQRTYPFYKLAFRGWEHFFAWEAMYAVQFFALEVFFRGFMIHPLKKSMGAYAVFTMAVPYCMIHFNKPLAEVLGAFVAGTILGTLSLRTRSIWCGVLIHVSVAVTMDLLSIYHVAGYPGNPRYIG